MTVTLKQIDTNITQVKSLGREYNELIHSTALMIFYHAAPKEVSADCVGAGNCTRAVKLVRAMPASMRRTTLIEWFKQFTPIRIKLSDNGDRCEFDPEYKKLSKADKLAWWKLEEAGETTFYEIAGNIPEDAKPMDFAALMKLVERLGSQIQKKVDEGKVKAEDVPSALALITAVSGIKVARVAPTPDNSNEEKAPSGTTNVVAGPRPSRKSVKAPSGAAAGEVGAAA